MSIADVCPPLPGLASDFASANMGLCQIPADEAKVVHEVESANLAAPNQPAAHFLIGLARLYKKMSPLIFLSHTMRRIRSNSRDGRDSDRKPALNHKQNHKPVRRP
ncbi:hypothetical protein [Microbulbifer aestuariivivens]|uniref:hypothetical protein n=1 Tax=Microbulbifer aestuariivivens TaxID=1908308 RepID=UPI0031ED4DCD